MTGSIMPPGPLSYVGEVSTPFITRTFNPDTSNNQFPVPTIWVNTSSSEAFMLVSKAGGVAEWLDLGSEHGVLDTITTPDSIIVPPTAGNIRFTQSGPINITGNAGTSTINFSVEDPITVNHGGTGSTSFNTFGPVVAGTTTTSPLTSVTPTSTVGVPLVSEGTSAHPAFGTAVVQGGGTGNTAIAAFSVVAGGTTNTSPLQTVSGVGTSGQILTSNGAGVLPTWQTHPSGAFSIVTQVFTTSGTYTPTAGMVYCIIEAIGGGGGGGGVDGQGVTNVAAGGGGGGGGYSRKSFSAATIGPSQTITIGAGGAGGAAGNNPGVTGGTTTVGSLLSAAGGTGGSGMVATTTAATVNGGDGGAGTLGDFNTIGTPGGAGMVAVSGAGILVSPGSGGSTFFGGGGRHAVGGASQDGTPGTSYGGGGSGATVFNVTTDFAGGTGFGGLVVVTEFI